MFAVDSESSSIRLARWSGIEWSLHPLVPLGALVGIWFAQVNFGAAADRLIVYALLTWPLAICWHELGHWRTLHRSAGRVLAVTLTPWGCSYRLMLPRGPQHRLQFAWAGPAMSGIGLLIALVLLSAGGSLAASLFEGWPQLAGEMGESRSVLLLKFFGFWNALLLVNLFPAFPFDGGYALHAVLQPIFGDRGASLIVRRSMLLTGAVLLLLAAVVSTDSLFAPGIPLWVPPALAGIGLVYAAQGNYERAWSCLEDQFAGYRYNYDDQETPPSFTLTPYFGTHDSTPTPEQQSPATESSQTAATAVEIENEPAAELSLDAILDHLQRVGYAALSEPEQQFLERESRRLRRRHPR